MQPDIPAEMKAELEEALNDKSADNSERIAEITKAMRDHLMEHGNLLQRADLLTGAGGERREAYDHPSVDFACTAALWTALLRRAGAMDYGQSIDTRMVPVMMAAMKMSRLAGNLGHADSALDIAGYMRTLEMVWEQNEPKEA